MNYSMAFDLRRVVAIAAAAFIGVFMLMAVMPASASTSAYIPKEWASDPDYHLGYRHSGFTGSSFSNAVYAADDPWDAVSGNWLDFHWGGVDTGVFTWQSACLSPSGGVYVGTAAISPMATEKTCSNSTTITRSNIAVDRTGRDWHYSAAAPAATKLDLRSVLVHEFGHAAGFAGHFAGSALCPGGSSDHTMCSGISAGEYHPRTLEWNDEQQIAMAY